jgi:hypothetical protein
MQKGRRAELNRKTARELASTGKFEDHRAIELMIIAQDISDPREVPGSDTFRRELRQICVRARSARLDRSNS